MLLVADDADDDVVLLDVDEVTEEVTLLALDEALEDVLLDAFELDDEFGSVFESPSPPPPQAARVIMTLAANKLASK